jgi:SAM-dependent methyltransferase
MRAEAARRVLGYTPLGWALRRVEQVALRRLGVLPRDRVLDLGCAGGGGLRGIAARGGQAFGLEPSLHTLRWTRGSVEGRAQLIAADFGRLPFRSGAFDKVICTNAFHRCPDPAATLRELKRVLRPGGLLVLVDPRADHPVARIAVEWLERVALGVARARTHSVEEWKKMLATAGFAAADARPGSRWRPAEHAEVFVEATT